MLWSGAPWDGWLDATFIACTTIQILEEEPFETSPGLKVVKAIGTDTTLFAAGLISLTATLAVLLARDVRTLERRPAG